MHVPIRDPVQVAKIDAAGKTLCEIMKKVYINGVLFPIL